MSTISLPKCGVHVRKSDKRVEDNWKRVWTPSLPHPNLRKWREPSYVDTWLWTRLKRERLLRHPEPQVSPERTQNPTILTSFNRLPGQSHQTSLGLSPLRDPEAVTSLNRLTRHSQI